MLGNTGLVAQGDTHTQILGVTAKIAHLSSSQAQAWQGRVSETTPGPENTSSKDEKVAL